MFAEVLISPNSFFIFRSVLSTWRGVLAVRPMFATLQMSGFGQWSHLQGGSMCPIGDMWTARGSILLPAHPNQHLCGVWRPPLSHLWWLSLSLPSKTECAWFWKRYCLSCCACAGLDIFLICTCKPQQNKQVILLMLWYDLHFYCVHSYRVPALIFWLGHAGRCLVSHFSALRLRMKIVARLPCPG